MAERAQGPAKRTVLSNTRLDASQMLSQEPDAVAVAVAAAAAASAAGGAGASAASVSAAARDAYDRLATPSFTPGANGESPFMTWGEVRVRHLTE